jgi:RNA polymerase sigma-70 factor (ECF subfamily)
MQEGSDEALMKAWAGGDPGAFEQLYARYRQPLYRYILRLSGDPVAANDLYQGCWEKVIKARKRYRPKAPFGAWLFRIARNHVFDHFRRSRPEDELKPEFMATDDPGPDQKLADADRAAALERALGQLPPEQRDVVLLKLEGGLDLQQIADISGTGRETAKSRLRYAIRKLRQAIDSQHRESS